MFVLKVFCCSKPHRQRTCAKRACSVPHRRCMVRYAPCDRVWDAATPLKLWLRSACIGDLPNAFVLVNTGAFLAVVIANNAGLIDWLSPSFSREGASRASSNTQELSNRKTWNVAQPRAYDYTLTIAQASASLDTTSSYSTCHCCSRTSSASTWTRSPRSSSPGSRGSTRG